MRGKVIPYAALLLLVQLAGGCSRQTPSEDMRQNAAEMAEVKATPSIPREDAPLIVAFGDSLFAGFGLPQDESFAPELQRALAARGVAAQVFNAAVSGDTTAAGLQRLAFTLDGLAKKPSLVIVELGANDMLRGLEPSAVRVNLDAILGELRKRGIPFVLAGMLASPNLGKDYDAAFNSIYPELADKYDAPLYPFLLEGLIGRRELLLPDGLHPNERGVDEMVTRIAPTVESALKDPKAD